MELKDSWRTMMKRLSRFLRRMMRSLQERCLGEMSDSRREKEKENQEAKIHWHEALSLLPDLLLVLLDVLHL